MKNACADMIGEIAECDHQWILNVEDALNQGCNFLKGLWLKVDAG